LAFFMFSSRLFLSVACVASPTIEQM